MGCSKANNAPEISEEDRLRILAARDAARRDAIDKLRETGMVLAMQSDAYRVHIVLDRIECEFSGNGLRFVVDGIDISDMVQKFGVSYTNDIPTFTMVLKPKPLRVPRTQSDNAGNTEE